MILANKEADQLGLKKDIITDLMVFVIPIAIVCARIYYVTFEWKQYVNQPFSELFAVWNGGIAIHGAIIGSVLTVIIYTHIKKYRSEEHTSELQSRGHLVCRLLLEKQK